MPIIRQDAHNIPKINNIIAGSSTECASKLSIFGKEMLGHATDKMFMSETLLDFVPSTQVIFSSRPDRNLNLLLNVWNEKISNKCPNVKLLINPPYTLKEKDNPTPVSFPTPTVQDTCFLPQFFTCADANVE